MKKIIGRILKWTGILLLAALIAAVAFRFLYGRNWGDAQSETIDIPYETAIADGVITPEELAIHYAPVIDQAVNVLLSRGGRGDFITAVNYDGDWSCLNNWENLASGDLGAVVYYSVQETETHWFIGYYFYHPRDDAEIWLDRHENDLEGIMLAVPKGDDGYLPPEIMYTQGHGNVYFYMGSGAESPHMLEGSHYGGALALRSNTDRPHIYITPNGTLQNCGHSVESAAGHSTYWSVGNSGVRYCYGGRAETPASWNGDFSLNRCAYDLRPLEELWAFREGPYDGTGVFGSFGAFDGDNWGEDKANPPWGWRNKTIYGFGGSFLTDPAWTINHAVSGVALSSAYTSNPYAVWRISDVHAVIPATVDASSVTLHLIRDGWEFSNPAWFTLTEASAGVYDVSLGGQDTLWIAAPEATTWRFEVRDPEGNLLSICAVGFEATYQDE